MEHINHMIDSEGNPIKPGIYIQPQSESMPILYYFYEENGKLRGMHLNCYRGFSSTLFDKLIPVAEWHFSGTSGFSPFEPLSQDSKKGIEGFAKSILEFINRDNE